MRYDLTDTTFVIPFGADSSERVQNCLTVINYLRKHFDTYITVVEQKVEGAESLVQCSKTGTDYSWTDISLYRVLNYPSEFCHRTKMLNQGFRAATTPYVVNYDTDVLLPVQAYLDARELLKNDSNCVFAFPFDGRFYNLIGDKRREVINHVNDENDYSPIIENLTINDGHWIHSNSLGGAVFANKSLYEEIGFENPNHRNWGYEDDERVARAQKLGFSIKRAPYILWHLDHPRNGQFYQSSQPFVLDYIRRLSPDQLREHIKTWNNDA